MLFTVHGLAGEVPPLKGRVNDHARILSPTVHQLLSERLAAYEQKTGHQLAVLTVPSLSGDPIEDYSIRVVEAWKLGKKGADDGILLLVASGDRKMRIEVGYGLEGSLPDAAAGRIVRDVMAPHFKRGDFDGGVLAAVNAIFAATGGESLIDAGALSAGRHLGAPGAAQTTKPVGTLGWFLTGLLKLAFFGIFVLVILGIIVANFLRGARSGGVFVSSGGFGSSDGGSFGGSSDSGFSGGGGSFGGGGASGDW